MHRYPDAGFHRYTFCLSFYALVHFYALFHMKKPDLSSRTDQVFYYPIIGVCRLQIIIACNFVLDTGIDKADVFKILRIMANNIIYV